MPVGAQNTGFLFVHSFYSFILIPTECASEFDLNFFTIEAFIVDLVFDAVGLQQSQDITETAPWQCNVVGEVVGTANNSRCVPNRKPQCLVLIEGWVLKSG